MGIKISDLNKATPAELTDECIIPTVVGVPGSEATKVAELGDVSDTVITNLATGTSPAVTAAQTGLSDIVITNLVGNSPTAQAAMASLSTSVAANIGSGIVTQTTQNIGAGATSVFVSDTSTFTVGGSIAVGGETRTILTIDPVTGEITFADPLASACTAPCPVINPAAGMSGAGIAAGTITATQLGSGVASPTGGLTMTSQGLAVNPTPDDVTIYIDAGGVDYVKDSTHQAIDSTTHGPSDRFTSLTHAMAWADDNIGSNTVKCTMIVESDIIEPVYGQDAIRTAKGRFGEITWESQIHINARNNITAPPDSNYPKITFPKDDSILYYSRIPLWLEHDVHIIRGLELHFPGGAKNDEHCLFRSIAGEIRITECKLSLGPCAQPIIGTGTAWESRRLRNLVEAVDYGTIRIGRGAWSWNNWNWLFCNPIYSHSCRAIKTSICFSKNS